MNYYPVEWMAAFLDKEPESRKEKAINIAKKHGFDIETVDINRSGMVWEIGDNDSTLVQPLSSIKGLGEKAIEQVLNHRPFYTIEEFLFHDEMSYSKLNKKCLDVLVRSEALAPLMDERFTNMKHFWYCVAVDRVRKANKFHENIELTKNENDFTEEEKIQYLVDLTGIFPMNRVVDEGIIRKLSEKYVPPISEYDPDLQLTWFIPRDIIPKKTKNGKTYWIVEVIDSTSSVTKIKCWGVRPEKDMIHINRPYLAKLDFDPQWGFSTRSIRHNFRLLG
tara:strand:- start:608 stop:1441 length:834 start_codon:yes stop_codon:yes gene_type:complete